MHDSSPGKMRGFLLPIFLFLLPSPGTSKAFTRLVKSAPSFFIEPVKAFIGALEALTQFFIEPLTFSLSL